MFRLAPRENEAPVIDPGFVVGVQLDSFVKVPDRAIAVAQTGVRKAEISMGLHMAGLHVQDPVEATDRFFVTALRQTNEGLVEPGDVLAILIDG